MILTAPCNTVHDKLLQTQTSLYCHNLGNCSESLGTATFLTTSLSLDLKLSYAAGRNQDKVLTFLPNVSKIQVEISTTTFHVLLLHVCHDYVY